MNRFFRYPLAIITGALSGFLIFYLSATVFLSLSDTEVPLWFVDITLLGGWAVSTLFLLIGTRKISEVITRSFFLGSVEWFIGVPIGLIFAGKTTPDPSRPPALYTKGDAVAYAMTAGDSFTIVPGAIAFVMFVICLIGFLVTPLIAPETYPERQ